MNKYQITAEIQFEIKVKCRDKKGNFWRGRGGEPDKDWEGKLAQSASHFSAPSLILTIN